MAVYCYLKFKNSTSILLFIKKQCLLTRCTVNLWHPNTCPHMKWYLFLVPVLHCKQIWCQLNHSLCRKVTLCHVEHTQVTVHRWQCTRFTVYTGDSVCRWQCTMYTGYSIHRWQCMQVTVGLSGHVNRCHVYCVQVTVGLVKQLYQRDCRRTFCPPGHWLSSRPIFHFTTNKVHNLPVSNFHLFFAVVL